MDTSHKLTNQVLNIYYTVSHETVQLYKEASLIHFLNDFVFSLKCVFLNLFGIFGWFTHFVRVFICNFFSVFISPALTNTSTYFK